MAAPPSYLAIGRIVQPHGIRGELSVAPLTDEEDRFAAGTSVALSRSPEGDERLTPHDVVSVRRHKGRYLVTLEGIGDRTEAEAHVGEYLLIPYEEAAVALDEGEVFVHELIGREVRDEAGKRLGEVVDVVETPGAAVVEIEDPAGGRRMLPFVAEFVRSVEDEAIVVRPPEGWHEL